MSALEQQFDRQRFPNGYKLVDGVEMHAENGEQFQIPPEVISTLGRPAASGPTAS